LALASKGSTESAAAALGIEKNRGELVQSVVPGRAAARAGIQQGDVIITINNRPVTPDDSLSYIVANLPSGSRIPIELIRNGRRQTVTAVVGERPTDEEVARLSATPQETEITEPAEAQQSAGQRSARESLGLTFQALTPEIARSLRLSDPTLRGVVIAAINPSSDAAAKGFQAGDIILSINQRPTRTPEEAAAVVDEARRAGRKSVLLMVRRGNTPPRFIGVDLTAAR
jgi:serine protease Do